MSTVKVQGNASGTGSITLASPNTNSNRTQTLPDADGTVLLNNSSDQIINGLTVGKGAGAVSTNTAVGASALSSGSLSGGNNTGIGYLALQSNTTAANVTAVGRAALNSNTTGDANTGLGGNSLLNNTTGAYNTAVGMQALQNNTTASNNTAVGYQAGFSQTTAGGGFNVLLGYQAGYTNNTYQVTYLGYQAGYNATGLNNTFIGANSGDQMTSGARNTILGRYNGNQGGLDIRTSNNYIVLSDGDGNPRGVCNGSGLWGFGASVPTIDESLVASGSFKTSGYVYPSVDNTWNVGLASKRWAVIYAATGSINTSDANTKQDIQSLNDAEKRVAIRIKGLIKKFRFKDAVAKKGNDARIHIGAIAQEVQSAFIAEGLDPTRYALFCSDTWYEVDGRIKPEEGGDNYTAETEGAIEVTRLGLRYEELLAFVIAAL